LRQVLESPTMISTVPLSEAPLGTRVRIRRLSASPEVSRRLRELGLCEHAVVSCLFRGHGNLICAVQNTRIGIDRNLAGTIVVSVAE
jgi:Fe2+ transport system protein FeoA